MMMMVVIVVSGRILALHDLPTGFPCRKKAVRLSTNDNNSNNNKRIPLETAIQGLTTSRCIFLTSARLSNGFIIAMFFFVFDLQLNGLNSSLVFSFRVTFDF